MTCPAVAVEDASIAGGVAPGFEPVAEAFAGNFAELGELGAAFAATCDGRLVVDLWGGVADAASGRPWGQDTLQLIFSGTKGLSALCIAMLLDRGLLRLEDHVSRHWPEFAAAGKDAITIAEVVSHRARLPAVRAPVGEREFLDARCMADLLAVQAPESDSRMGLVYHALTYGWLCDELVYRVDGRSIGRFFDEEVATPLGLELWIGLPAALKARVATLHYGPAWGLSPVARGDAFPGDPVWEATWTNPRLFPPGQELPWNRHAWHAAEIPGANAIGAVRSIARMYGALACGGALDGVRLLSSDGLAAACTELSSGIEPYREQEMAFGVGFALHVGDGSLGPPAAAFGHSGTGGSTHGAWPEERVGFSYAMNQLRDDPDGDPRASALLEALHRCAA